MDQQPSRPLRDDDMETLGGGGGISPGRDTDATDPGDDADEGDVDGTDQGGDADQQDADGTDRGDDADEQDADGTDHRDS